MIDKIETHLTLDLRSGHTYWTAIRGDFGDSVLTDGRRILNFDGNFRYTGYELIAVVELVQYCKDDGGQIFMMV